MKTGNIILEVTHGLDVELGQLPWSTVKRIVEKHIDKARKELLHVAATELNISVKTDPFAMEIGGAIHRTIDRRTKIRSKNEVAFHRLP